MKLQVEIPNRTNLTWTLDTKKISYIVGSDPSCQIVLPYDNVVSKNHLELSYKSQECKWYLKDLSSTHGTFIENRPISPDTLIPIRGQTNINLGKNLILLVTPEDSKSSTSNSPALETSTRLLCGYAYLGGMFNGFELLNQLRCDPYKAQIPGSSLDLDKVTRHATQSVIISLSCAIFALLIAIIQFWSVQFFDGNLELQLAIAFIPASVIAWERIYWRWFQGRKFLKKNYYTKYDSTIISIKYIDEIINYFQKKVFTKSVSQNIIIFSGNNPFLGAGERIPGSSWILPIIRKPIPIENRGVDFQNIKQSTQLTKNSKLEEINILNHEFYQAADRDISRLGLPNLEMFSQLFVDGFELEADRKILTKPTTRPATLSLDDPLWSPEQPASSKRSYRVYRYVDVERDYVLSFFLRFYNVGKITFVESSAYILTGIDRDRFSLASTLEDNWLSQVLKTLLVTIVFSSGLYIPIAAWYLCTFLFNIIIWKINDAKQRKAARFKEEYNYGLPYTLREFIAERLSLESERRFESSRGVKRKKVFSFNFNKIKNPILQFGLLPIRLFLWMFKLVFKSSKRVNREVKTNLDYYGVQDVLMYWKAIQDSIFCSTVKLLKDRQVDTSQLESAIQQIINIGSLTTAGTINDLRGAQFGGGFAAQGNTYSGSVNNSNT